MVPFPKSSLEGEGVGAAAQAGAASRDAVRIRMSTNPVPTISQTDQTRDWFGSLERCFGWNDRAEQKPLGHARRTDA